MKPAREIPDRYRIRRGVYATRTDVRAYARCEGDYTLNDQFCVATTRVLIDSEGRSTARATKRRTLRGQQRSLSSRPPCVGHHKSIHITPDQCGMIHEVVVASSLLVQVDGLRVWQDVLAVEAEVALAVDDVAVARQDLQRGACH